MPNTTNNSSNNKAEFRPFIYTDYKPLHTLLPLKQPLSINLYEPNNRCNLNCEFCYRFSQENSKSDAVDFSFYEKVAKDLTEFDEPFNMFYLGSFGEPFLWDLFPEAIKLFKTVGKVTHIKTITNGTLLSPDKSEKVIAAGLDSITISVNGISDEQYLQVTHRNVKFKEFLENVKYLFSIKGGCHIHIKCIGDYFSESEREKFLEIFSPYCDTIHITHAINQWHGIAIPPPPYPIKGENINKFNLKYSHSKKTICPYPFYWLSILPSGVVHICPGDDKGLVPLGDVNNSSLKEIWEGEELMKLRIAHLTQCNLPAACDECHYYELMTSEDLTPYREELLQKYSIDT